MIAARRADHQAVPQRNSADRGGSCREDHPSVGWVSSKVALSLAIRSLLTMIAAP